MNSGKVAAKIFLTFAALQMSNGKISPCSESHSAEVCHIGDFYDKAEYPNKPVGVQPYFVVKDISEVNEDQQTITLLLEMGMIWKDKRISANEKSSNISNSRWRLLSTSDIDDVWTPILYYANAISITTLGSFGNQGGLAISFWYRHPNYLFLVEVQSVTISCNMDFEYFPNDGHSCPFSIRAWNGHLRFIELRKPYLLDEDSKCVENVTINSLKLNFDVEMTVNNSTHKEQYWQGREFSFANVAISLKRNRVSYKKIVTEFYATTAIFAILSLLSFAITPDQVPGRMGMLVTLYLMLINTYTNIDAPSKRGFSYADVWFAGCQVPVAFAIIEYGAILTLLRTGKFQDCYHIARWMDIIAFAASVGFLSLFNLAYWITQAY